MKTRSSVVISFPKPDERALRHLALSSRGRVARDISDDIDTVHQALDELPLADLAVLVPVWVDLLNWRKSQTSGGGRRA